MSDAPGSFLRLRPQVTSSPKPQLGPAPAARACPAAPSASGRRASSSAYLRPGAGAGTDRSVSASLERRFGSARPLLWSPRRSPATRRTGHMFAEWRKRLLSRHPLFTGECPALGEQARKGCRDGSQRAGQTPPGEAGHRSWWGGHPETPGPRVPGSGLGVTPWVARGERVPAGDRREGGRWRLCCVY